MIKQAIKNVNIVNHDQSFYGNIFLEDGKIVKLEKKSSKLDSNANYCLPAFIDQHNHGGYGINFDDPKMLTEENFKILKQKLTSEGVGKIFVTTVTQPISNLKIIGEAIDKIKSNLIAGWHIEGPFIDKVKKGAHDEKFICELTSNDMKILDGVYPKKKLLVIHPSNQNLKVIQKDQHKNFWYSIGHTNCSYDQARKALESGCSQFTHLYNAMTQFHHRNPGVVLAALADKNSFVEIIGDSVHVGNDTLHGTNLICGANRMILISDCLWVKGLKDGKYQLGTLPIVKRKNHCYLENGDTLAGGAVKYIDLVKNYYKTTQASMQDMVKITSYNTAKQFKIKDAGIIKNNTKANFIIVDKNFNLIESYIK